MTQAKWHKSLLLLVLTVIGAALMASSYFQVERDRQMVYQQRERLLDTEYRTLIHGYETGIALLLDDLAMDDAFLELLSRAASPSVNEAEQDGLRHTVYDRLTPFYQRMQRFGFNHLHIYLPDNRSFLRLHRPHRYGDDQTHFRWTVTVANQERRTTSGFEVARIVDGYRTVRPLFYADEHIGAVDIGISAPIMLMDLNSLFAETFYILLRRDRLMSISLSDLAMRYSAWPVSDAYAMVADTLDVHHDPLDLKRGSCIDFWTGVSTRVCDRILQRMDNGETIVFGLSEAGRYEIIGLLPLRDPGNHLMGYLVSREPSTVLDLILDNHRRQLLWYLFALVVIGILGMVLIDRRLRLQYFAGYDQLTGLYNRRMFIDLFHRARHTQDRTGESLALIMADIDHFKNVNDQWGHQMGDKLLLQFAQVLAGNVRAGDVVGRWGGEEFIIMLPDARSEAVADVAEKLRTATMQIINPGGEALTASFGVLMISADDRDISLDALMAAVDKLLYQAKQEGRNRAIAGAVDV